MQNINKTSRLPLALWALLACSASGTVDAASFSSDFLLNGLAVEEEPFIQFRTETDARGNKTKYTYNQFYKPVSIVYADGTSHEFRYQPGADRVVWEKNERGIIAEYQYDNKGNLVRQIDASGTPDQRVTEYAYAPEAFGQVTEIKYVAAANNTADVVIRFTYDPYGNVKTETYVGAANPGDIVVEYDNPDVNGFYQTKKINDIEHLWRYRYDAVGNVTYEADPTGVATFYTYDHAGQISKTETGVDANFDGIADGDTVEVQWFTYNHSGSPLTAQNADGVQRMAYNKAGKLLSHTDASNHVVNLGYDAAGRIGSVSNHDTARVTLSYKSFLLDKADFSNEDVSASYLSNQYGFDSRQHLNAVTTSGLALQTRQITHALDNSTVTVVDPELNTVVKHYDTLQRLVKITSVDGDTHYSYDKYDNILSVTDPASRVTSFTYDVSGNVLTETKDGKLRSYVWDNNGNLASVTNAEGEKTDYDYDAANRLTSEWVYNSAAALQRHIWHRYDSYGRYIGYRDHLDTSVAPATFKTASAAARDVVSYIESTVYDYNTINQVINVTINYGFAWNKTEAYTYYPNGLLKTYVNPENITYSYTYDANNQLTGITIPNEGAITYSDFKWDKPQLITLPGNNKIVPLFDNYFRPSQWQLLDGGDNQIGKADTFTYDLVNNITGFNTENGDFHFNYDDSYRLNSWDRSGAVNAADNRDVDYSYDGVGNRLSDSSVTGASGNWAYGSSNELTAVPGKAVFVYDDNGHMVYRKGSNPLAADPWVNADAVVVYRYNAQERLSEVYLGTDGAGCLDDADTSDCSATIHYEYDPYGRRIKKNVNGTITYFVYNRSGLAAEYNSSGTLTREYHFKPGQTWSTEPVLLRTGGQVYYYQNDHLATPKRLIAKNGSVAWQATHDAFGKASIEINTVENNLRFPGQYYDSETGVHQNYFRDYDSTAGRYLQSDPIGLGGGLNTYLYAYADPVNVTDPTGEIAPIVARCLIGCAAGAAIAGGGAALMGCDPWMPALEGCGMGCLGGLMGGPKGIPRPKGVPKDWIKKPGKKPGHTKYANPENPNHDYVRVKPDGTITQVRDGKALDQNGNPVPLKSPEAHYPPSDFTFRE